jgi:transcription termination/antitermination protein NusA
MSDLLTAAGVTGLADAQVRTFTIAAVSNDAALVRLAEGRDALLPRAQFYPQRPWQVGERLVGLIDDPAAARPQVSVTDPRLVEAVLALYVPELRSAEIRVMGVARAPGVRAKVAVAATVDGIDALRVVVGRNANRVRAAQELLGDRLEIVAWHPETDRYVAAALAPVEPSKVELAGGRAIAHVPAHVAQAAQGGGNLNLVLAARLCGVAIELRVDHEAPR